jgi:hypothetical protein
MAGAAKADITPDLDKMEVPSAGYGARGRTPMEGVHDPVFCKTLVVSDGTEKAALVTCDLVGISTQLRDKVLAKVADLGLDDRTLMMTASHTHSGPGAMMKNFIAGIVFGRYNEDLVEETADKIAAALHEADRGQKLARFSAAAAPLPGVSKNRRDPAKSYNYDTRRFSSAYDPQNPKNTVDDLLTVLRFDDSEGRVIAVVFSFAAHGTVMGADNLEISADWPGAAQAAIEAAFPGATALFVNGAIGDQAPDMVEDGRSDWDYVAFIGGKVGGAAVGLARAASPIAASPVRAKVVHRQMPPGQSIMGYRVIPSLIKYYFPEMPLHGLRIGDALLMGAPVEMVADIGITMREGAKGLGVKFPIVAGLADAGLLYCAAPDDFEEGGYEVDNTIWGPVEAGIIIGEELLMVQELMKP